MKITRHKIILFIFISMMFFGLYIQLKSGINDGSDTRELIKNDYETFQQNLKGKMATKKGSIDWRSGHIEYITSNYEDETKISVLLNNKEVSYEFNLFFRENHLYAYSLIDDTFVDFGDMPNFFDESQNLVGIIFEEILALKNYAEFKENITRHEMQQKLTYNFDKGLIKEISDLLFNNNISTEKDWIMKYVKSYNISNKIKVDETSIEVVAKQLWKSLTNDKQMTVELIYDDGEDQSLKQLQSYTIKLYKFNEKDEHTDEIILSETMIPFKEPFKVVFDESKVVALEDYLYIKKSTTTDN